MPNSTRWHVAAGCSLRWRQWDDQWIVYHTGSGDTHMLDEASAQAVRRLESGPADAQELARAVSATMGVGASSEVSAYVDKLLPQLDALGLIEPAP